MNAILVCVDFSDVLQITLPYNRHHFDKLVVVTSPKDHDTYEVCLENRATPFVTDSFYENGARFNKFKALEQGLDYLGREGWTCLLDCDVLWPKKIPVELNTRKVGMTGKEWVKEFCQIGCLYTPRRRMMIDITQPIPNEDKWKQFPLHAQCVEWAGYTQIFHSGDTALGTPPWHEIDWIHAGGGDSFLQAKWPKEKKIRPIWEVLHLGPSGENWLGRVTKRTDGSLPEGAEVNRAELQQLIRKRRTNPTNPFFHEKLRGNR